MFGTRLPTPRELLPFFVLGTLEARFLKILLKGVICLSVSEDLHIDDDVQVLGSGVGRDGRRQGVSYVKAKLVALGRRSNCGYWWSGGASNRATTLHSGKRASRRGSNFVDTPTDSPNSPPTIIASSVQSTSWRAIATTPASTRRRFRARQFRVMLRYGPSALRRACAILANRFRARRWVLSDFVRSTQIRERRARRRRGYSFRRSSCAAASSRPHPGRQPLCSTSAALVQPRCSPSAAFLQSKCSPAAAWVSSKRPAFVQCLSTG